MEMLSLAQVLHRGNDLYPVDWEFLEDWGCSIWLSGDLVAAVVRRRAVRLLRRYG